MGESLTFKQQVGVSYQAHSIATSGIYALGYLLRCQSPLVLV